jgi:hypothetical protein
VSLIQGKPNPNEFWPLRGLSINAVRQVTEASSDGNRGSSNSSPLPSVPETLAARRHLRPCFF